MKRRLVLNEKRGVSIKVLNAYKEAAKKIIERLKEAAMRYDMVNDIQYKQVCINFNEPLFGILDNIYLTLYNFEGNVDIKKAESLYASQFNPLSRSIRLSAFSLDWVIYMSDFSVKLTHELEHAYQYSLKGVKPYHEPYETMRKNRESIYKLACSNLRNKDEGIRLVSRLVYGLSREECDAVIQSLFAQLRTFKLNGKDLDLKETDSYSRYNRLVGDFNSFLKHERDWNDGKELFFFHFNYRFFKRYFKKQLDYLNRKIQKVFNFYSDLSYEELSNMIEEERLKRLFQGKPLKINIL